MYFSTFKFKHLLWNKAIQNTIKVQSSLGEMLKRPLKDPDAAINIH